MCSILPTYKTYYYFDQKDHLQTRDLNVLEWLLRRIFGCFKETHLAEVWKQAFPISLNGRCTTAQDNQKLIKFFEWLNHSKRRDCVPTVAEYAFSSTKRVWIGMHYHLGYKSDIDYMRFYIILKDTDNKDLESADIQFFKNKNGVLTVNILSRDPFYINYKESVTEGLKSDMVKVISQIIKKIGKNTHNLQILFPLLDYQHDNCRRTDLVSSSIINTKTSEELNNDQVKAMDALGWTFVGSRDERNFYSPNYTNTESSKCKQRFSFEFALDFLNWSKSPEEDRYSC